MFQYTISIAFKGDRVNKHIIKTYTTAQHKCKVTMTWISDNGVIFML